MFCLFCDFATENYFEYELHMLQQPAMHSYVCDVCSEEFSVIKSLMRHVNKKHNRSHYENNMIKIHISNPEVGKRCCYCPNKSSTFKEYICHRQIMHSGWSLVCPTCELKFPNPKELFNHFQFAHSMVNNVDLYCEKCELHFYCPTVYKEHMYQVHKMKRFKVTYQCVLCPSNLTGYEEFCLHVHQHRRYKRSDNPEFVYTKNGRPEISVSSTQCQLCSKIVVDDLNKHIKPSIVSKRKLKSIKGQRLTHHEHIKNQAKFKMQVSKMFCLFCDFATENYFEYELHMLHQPANHSYVCDICSEEFPVMKGLMRHVKKNHNIFEYQNDMTKNYVSNPEIGMRCCYCPNKLATFKDYVFHRQVMHTNWYVACPTCKFKFANPTELFKHFEVTHSLVNNVDLYCKKCEFHFYCPTMYKGHMIQVHKEMASKVTYQCVLCPSNLIGFEEFCLHVHQHRRYKRTDNPEFVYTKNGRPEFSVSSTQCQVCSKIVADDLNKHIKLEFSCLNCEKSFQTLPSLKRHALSHREKNLSCLHCDKKFLMKHLLNNHIRTVHLKKFQFLCEYCDKKYFLEEKLKRHINNVHYNKFKYSCKQCNRGFNFRYELTKHEELKHFGLTFQCTYCQKTFKDVQYFKEHQKTHEPSYRKEIYACEVCGKILTHIKSYKVHMKSHTGAAVANVCHVCGKNVTSKASLRHHMRTHTGEKPFQCHICGKSFTTKNILKTHKVVHSKEKPFGCQLCDKSFTQKGSLNIHVRLHTGEKPYECAVCFKRYVSRTSLNSHRNPVKCQRCNKWYQSAAKLKKHSYVHAEKRFECYQCGKRFVFKNVLNHHIQSTHKKPPRTDLICPHCGKKFKETPWFEKHVSSHDPNHKPEFQCPICLKGLTCGKYLEAHIRKRHVLNSKFPCHFRKYCCDICGKEMLKKNLKIHMMSHTGEKPFECNYCGKAFVTRKCLKLHTRIHTKEKPYLCATCGKGFTQKYSVTVHMRYHTGERPHRCLNCPKGFVTSSELKNHACGPASMSNMPKTIRLRSCEICILAFNDNSQLQQHFKKMHKLTDKDTIFTCPFCSKNFKNRQKYMKKHVWSVHDKNYKFSFTCSVCDKTMSYEVSYIKHMETHNIEEPDYRKRRSVCEICGKEVLKKNIRPHMKVHMGVKPHKCEFCGKFFGNRKILRHHIRTHTKEKPHKCPICFKGFTQPYTVTIHMRYHTGERPFSCCVCNRGFVTKAELKQHNYLDTLYDHHDIHNDTNEISLSENDKIIFVKENEGTFEVTDDNDTIYLLNHNSVANASKPTKSLRIPNFSPSICLEFEPNEEIDMTHYKCQRCEQMFINTLVFQRHIEKGKCYVNNCDLCSLNFNKNSEFYAHYAMMHTDRAVCHFCFKTFLYEKNVKEHVMRHLDQFRHKCEKCNKGFFTVREYRNHFKNRHMGIRYQCELCDRSFADEYYFKKHQDTHVKLILSNLISKFNLKDCEIWVQDVQKDPTIKFINGRVKVPTYKCHVCFATFHMDSELDWHKNKECNKNEANNNNNNIEDPNEDGGVFSCTTCWKVFLSKPSLQEHINLHYINSEIDKEEYDNFHNNFALLRPDFEEEDQQPIEETLCIQHPANILIKQDHFSCNKCEKVFFSFNGFKEHVKKEKCLVIGKCCLCREMFASNLQLTAKYIKKHFSRQCKVILVDIMRSPPGTRRLRSTKSNLLSKLKTGDKHARSKKYSCYVCFEKFASKELLETHKILHKNEEKLEEEEEEEVEKIVKEEDKQNYKCTSCNVFFENQLSIKNHIHTQYFCKYYCKLCNRQFNTKGGFIVHVLQHGMKSTMKYCYKCESCPLSFDDYYQVKRHYASAHSVVPDPPPRRKMYKCESCTSSFDDCDQLIGHRVNVHTQIKKPQIEKPQNNESGSIPIHDCDICYDVFASLDALERHKLLHKTLAQDQYKIHKNFWKSQPEAVAKLSKEPVPQQQPKERHILPKPKKTNEAPKKPPAPQPVATTTSNQTPMVLNSQFAMPQSTGIMSQSTGLMSQSTGLMSQSTGLMSQSSGLMPQSTGLMPGSGYYMVNPSTSTDSNVMVQPQAPMQLLPVQVPNQTLYWVMPGNQINNEPVVVPPPPPPPPQPETTNEPVRFLSEPKVVISEDNSNFVLPIITSISTVVENDNKKDKPVTKPGTEYETEFAKFIKGTTDSNQQLKPVYIRPKPVKVTIPDEDPRPKISVKPLTELIDCAPVQSNPYSIGPKLVQCQICKNKFLNWNLYRQHMVDKHNKYPCPFYNCMVLRTPSQQESHMYEVHFCTWCKRMYSNLQGHVQNLHGNDAGKEDEDVVFVGSS
ncbi:unnamed protein product [Ceutorhynchus assimilis]|uniref:C2H2-type domain-containing protein n=1 Tax=Ceutorhynchus assimilis TaxID=467358 RepID=A0A9N9QFW3_9CUCU|nr:unnamed protein product [Ceutorhynchus assimilis]